MKRKEANFEVLRVVLMLLIVCIHAIIYGLNAMHSFGDVPQASFAHDCLGSVLYVSTQSLLCLAVSSVNCFVLITGYFMYQTSFVWRKVGRVWCQVLFYSVLITAMSLLLYGNGMSLAEWKQLALSLFPILTNQYWFVTNYLGLLVLVPFLAKLIAVLERREYEILLAVLLLFSFNPYHWTFGLFNHQGLDLTWFVFLFLIGAFVRKYNPWQQLQAHWGKLLCGSLLLLTGYICFKFKHLDPYQLRDNFLIEYNGYTLFVSLFLFMFFKHWQMKENLMVRVLMTIAPYSFSVYLIHDHGMLRYHLWQEWVCLNNYTGSLWLLPLLLLWVVGIFGVCVAIDYLRARIFALLKL